MVSKELNKSGRVALITFALFLAGCGTRQYVRDFSIVGAETKSEFASEEQVTAGNEANYAPELSPNGEFILFVSEKSGNKDLWEKRAVGGFVKQLTSHPADDFSPAMSPDGKHIAFVTRRGDAAGNIVMASSTPSRFGFGSKKLDANLSEIGLPNSEEMSPSWYPGSDRVIFTSRLPGETLPRIMSVEVDHPNPKPIFDWRGQSPAVSPLGDKITFSRDGAIFLGDLGGKAIQVTKGGAVKDGQPRFARDGESIVFVRYADDSNGDQRIDGKDFGSIWRVTTKQEEGVSLSIRDLAVEPLTDAARPHYFPEDRPPYLYFTMQNKGNLDVYRLPKEGPVRLGDNLSEISAQFESERAYGRKLFILRKGRSFLCRAKVTSDCGEIMLRELRWLVQERKAFEARETAENLKNSQPPESTLRILGELALIDLSTQRLSLFEQKLPPSPEVQGALEVKLKQIATLMSAALQDQARIKGQTLLLEAKILAALRKFSEAEARLGSIQKEYKNHGWLSAEAAYLSARLVPFFGDKSRAVEALRSVVVAHPNQDETVKQAAKAAVRAVGVEGGGRLEPLASLRDRSRELKYLSSEAHVAIAEEYEKTGKLAVARNEYRQIVLQYKNEDDLQLKIAEKLVQDLEQNGQGGEAEEILLTLFESKKGTSGAARAKALTLLEDHWVRRGEGMLREKEPGQAIKLYRRVLDLDPRHVAANRGLVDAAFQRKSHNEVITILEKQADEEDADAKALYAHGYALTYRIDEAVEVTSKIEWVNRCIALIEQARELDSQILQIHQTLGWLYVQKDFYLRKLDQQAGLLASASRRYGIFKEFFGVEKPNYLEMSVDSYLLAYSLSDDGSVDRANLDLNLGNAYFELHNYPKALEFFSKRIRMLGSIPLRDLRGEGLLFRNAGRSAFYSEELAYGEVLQRRALSAWERAGSERDVAYSLDALALTLREEKKFKEALQVYERLQKVQLSIGDQRNASQTKVNLAFTLYLDGQYEAALSMFDDAESSITAKGSSDEEDTSKESKDAIKVDVAGQDSAAKGLDEFLIRDLIVTTRYQIFQKSGYSNEADVQLERKLALLSEPSKMGGVDNKPRTEERAITINRRANQFFRDGRLRQAAESFGESAILARTLCLDLKVHCKDEALNVLSMYRVHLLRGRLAVLESAERDAIIAGMSERIDSSDERAVKGSRLDLLMSRKLRELRLAIRCTPTTSATSGPAASAGIGPANCAKEGEGRADLEVLTKDLGRSDLAADERGRIEVTVKFAKGEMETQKPLNWVDLSRNGSHAEGLEALREDLLGVPRGLTLLERVTALRMVREAVRKSSAPPAIFHYMSLYDDIRLIDVSTRLGLSPETLTALIQRGTVKGSGELTRIYALQMGPTEIVLADSSKLFTGRAETVAQAARQAVDAFERRQKDEVKGPRSLYVVPLDATAHLGIASMLRATGDQQMSEVPSIRLIDGFDQRNRISKIKVSVVGIHEAQKDLLADLSKEVVLTETKEASRQALEGSDVVLLNIPIFLNDTDASASRIGLLGKQARKDFRLLSFRALGSLKLGEATSILFSNIQTEDPASSGLAEGWVGLTILLYQSGLPTALVPCSSDLPLDSAYMRKIMAYSPSEVAAMGRVQSGGGKCILRVLGNSGVNSKRELEFASQSLGKKVEAANEAADLEDWGRATNLWREAAFFAEKSGKPEDLAEARSQGLQSSIRARSYRDALFFQESIMANVAKAGNQELIAKSRIEYAKICVKAEEFETADRIFEEAVGKQTEQGNWGEVGKLFQFLAVSSQGQKQYEKAAAYFEKSHDAYRQSGQMGLAAGRLADAANIQKDGLNDKGKALKLYQAAEEELRQTEDADARWSVVVDKSNTLTDLGNTNDAISSLQALDVVIPQNKVRLRVRVLQGLANAFFRGGLFQKSAAANERTIALAKKIEEAEPKAIAEIDALNLQGYLQAKLGSTSDAFKTFSKALDIAKVFKLVGKQAILLNNIGFWQREDGLLESSVLVFNEALALDRALKSISGVAFDLRNLAMSQILLGQFDLAKENLGEALKLSREAKVVYNEAYSQFALGDLALRRGELKIAEEHLQAATKIAEESSLQDFYWRGLAALANVKDKQGKPAEAASYYGKSVKTIESLRAGLQSQNFRSGFQSDRGVQSVYQSYVALLMKQGKVEDAWVMSERSRARAFIDSLGTQTGSAVSQAKLADVISPAEITRIIGSEASLIEYMVTEQELYAWVVRAGRINGVSIAIKSADLKRLVDQNRELTQNFSSLDYNGKELAKYLLEPVKALFAGSKGIVIVPHGVLHYLSMAALPFESEYLIDRFSLGYLESATLARFVDKEKKADFRTASIVAFGNPSVGKELDLPFAEREVYSIARYYKSAQIFTGKKATKQALLSQGSKTDIIHIASHGEFNELSPGDSRLRLVGSASESGDLSVQEVLNFQTTAKLVALSACETGLGKISSGDEIVGMNRAFFLAGANSIISSLWRISDVASAVAMKRFYRNLAEGDSVPSAMRKAQILVRNYYPHPAYWASYRVLGVGI